MSALREIRKLEAVERAGVVRRLKMFLTYALMHALRDADMMGRPMTLAALDIAGGVLYEKLRAIADAGALYFFGIIEADDMRRVPCEVGEVMPGSGVVGIKNINDMVRWIATGGARGRGWVAPGELTVDDLGR